MARYQIPRNVNLAIPRDIILIPPTRLFLMLGPAGSARPAARLGAAPAAAGQRMPRLAASRVALSPLGCYSDTTAVGRRPANGPG